MIMKKLILSGFMFIGVSFFLPSLVNAQSYEVDRSAWYAVDGVSQDYVVDSEDGYCSLYMDPNRSPHVMYSGGSFPIYTLTYLTWNGTSWEDETGVEGDPAVGTFGEFESGGNYDDPQILVGSTEAYSLWFDYSSGVNYAVNSGTGFTVPALMPDFDEAAYLFDTAIDDSDTVHVLFEDDWDFSGSGVYYTTYSGGSWSSVVEVLSSVDGLYPYDGSIDVDASGNPYIVLSLVDSSSYRNLYYYFDTNSGSGVTFSTREQVTTSTNADIDNDNPVIRVSDEGDEYLSWIYIDDDGAETSAEIRFLEKGAGWNEANLETIDIEPDSFAYYGNDMELDTDGVPNIAWITNEYLAGDAIVNVYYTYLDEGVFVVKDIALNYTEFVGVGFLYLYMDLEVASDNAPNIIVSDIYGAIDTVYFTKQNSTQLEPFCGDGNIDPGEECDDGNTSNGDGCSAVCTIEEEGFYCGDGNLDDGEECDDGNDTNGDGCSSACEIELDDFLPETGELPETSLSNKQSGWLTLGVDLVLLGVMLFISMNILKWKGSIKDYIVLTLISGKNQS